MSNRRVSIVSIIERVKRNGKWVWGEKWELPVRFTLKEGSRQGKFYLLWYRGNDKQFTPVPPSKQEKLPDLKESLRLAKMKQRHLEDAADGLERPDPITPVNRVTNKVIHNGKEVEMEGRFILEWYNEQGRRDTQGRGHSAPSKP